MGIKFESTEERLKRIGQIVQKPSEKKKVARAGAKLTEALDTLMKLDPEKPKTLFHAPKVTRQDYPVSIRFPAEVLEFFKKDGPGWQTRINEVLLEHVRKNRPL